MQEDCMALALTMDVELNHFNHGGDVSKDEGAWQ